MTVGRELSGQKHENMFEGGSDADELEAVFFLTVPKIWGNKAFKCLSVTTSQGFNQRCSIQRMIALGHNEDDGGCR